MQGNRTAMMAAGLATLLAASGAASAGVTFSDEQTMLDALPGRPVFVETFESMHGMAPVYGWDFGGGLPVTVTSNGGIREDRIEHVTDNHGAIAHEGTEFWKIRGGSRTIDFGGAMLDGFGFYYSDMEAAVLSITFHGTDGDEVALLDDDNSGSTAFLGYRSGSPFDAVTISWNHHNGDGVGIDRMVAVTTPIPTPGAGLLAGAAFLLIGRRRPRR